MKEDRLYLIHILECTARIEQYTRDGRDAYLADTKTQDAVIRNLQVLAESTQRLSIATKARRAQIDWRGIAAFRNIAVHGYLGIDAQRVWDIVERDIPVLKVAVSDLLRDIDSPLS